MDAVDFGDIHAIPPWEDERHVESPNCFCCPVLVEEDLVTGRRLYSHYAREEAH